MQWASKRVSFRRRGYFLNRRWVRTKVNYRARYRRGFTGGYPRISDRAFSHTLSSLVRKNIKVKSLNVFTYLVRKGVMSFRNHQRHFWHPRLRGRR